MLGLSRAHRRGPLPGGRSVWAIADRAPSMEMTSSPVPILSEHPDPIAGETIDAGKHPAYPASECGPWATTPKEVRAWAAENTRVSAGSFPTERGSQCGELVRFEA
jgi:hypothetical protein